MMSPAALTRSHLVNTPAERSMNYRSPETIEEHDLLVQVEKQLYRDAKSILEIEEDGEESRRRFEELERAIQAKLAKVRALRRDLELCMEEAETEEERERIAQIVSAHVSTYHDIQKELRQSFQNRRQKWARRIAVQRQELFGGEEAAARRRQLISEADVVAKSRGITESLRRTRQVMEEELEHTSTTLAAMDISHSQLKRTQDQYIGQHGLLYKSKGLLRTLHWQNRSERILLWCGLVLFALTSSYIAHKRAIYFVPESIRPMTILASGVRFVTKVTRGKGAESNIHHRTTHRNNHGYDDSINRRISPRTQDEVLIEDEEVEHEAFSYEEVHNTHDLHQTTDTETLSEQQRAQGTNMAKERNRIPTRQVEQSTEL